MIIYLNFKRFAEKELLKAYVKSSAFLNLCNVHYWLFFPVICNQIVFQFLGCVEFSLGMEDGRILDTGINASSCRTPAKNGRLNYASGSSWCAGTSDTNPYLQIDLQTLHIICAVSTQGNSKEDQWVKTYTLQLSTNGITWKNYTELGGQVKV